MSEITENHTITNVGAGVAKAIMHSNPIMLSAFRDALLPKFMSGEINVSNVNILELSSADKLLFV